VPRRGTWVFAPDSGGKRVPEPVKLRTEQRIRRESGSSLKTLRKEQKVHVAGKDETHHGRGAKPFIFALGPEIDVSGIHVKDTKDMP
jgi:hypothetical protein